MRKHIADLLFRLAKRAAKRADDTSDPFWRGAWLRRARLWADLELLVEGLIDWPGFLRHRRHPSLRPTIHTRRPT